MAATGSTKVVIALGDTLLLRDPAQGQDDIIALGLLRYDVESRRGLVHNVTTTMESGQRWVVHGENQHHTIEGRSGMNQPTLRNHVGQC